MELKQFVSETLLQIYDGIETAQKQLSKGGADLIINPNTTLKDDGQQVTGGSRMPVHSVEFDVAILANKSTEKKGGFGLTVASFLKLDAGVAGAESAGRVSRIKFKVPMSYPMYKKPEKRTR